MTEPLTVERFGPLLDTAFTVDHAGAAVPLLLTKVEDLGQPAHGEPPRVPFRLEFLGPVDPAFAQATLPLEHPALGHVEIFLVPIARNAAGTRYEAVFN